jgi:bifunctional isochorismate lyase / aryl carrier protein
MPQAHEFTPNKTNWPLHTSRAVLLVHDMQQYFLDFYDLTQEPIPELIQNTKALIDAARQSNIPVVYTAQPGNQSPEYRQLLTDFWGPGLKDEPSITQIFPKVKSSRYWQYHLVARVFLMEFLFDTGLNHHQLLQVEVYYLSRVVAAFE